MTQLDFEGWLNKTLANSDEWAAEKDRFGNCEVRHKRTGIFFFFDSEAKLEETTKIMAPDSRYLTYRSRHLLLDLYRQIHQRLADETAVSQGLRAQEFLSTFKG